MYTYDYPRPSVTADAVVITREDRPHVLLVRRKHDPFAGAWALPGGFIDLNETLVQTARRELEEETGVRLADGEALEQLQTFGDPGRDPRGRTISVAFLVRVAPGRYDPKGSDDAAEAAWHPLDRPPPLAFDHDQILAAARLRLGLADGGQGA